MTIMFCDIVGSTALAARLDPEDLRDLLTVYQEHATAIVKAAGGRVARYQGDGILAYFGYPLAGEDDAERAVGAGLELAQGIDGSPTENLRVRVGIATGVVLVGELLGSNAADSPPVVGETANLAARLQELANPDAVVICDTTHGLTGGMFEYADLGLQRARGLAEPLQAWRVVKHSRIASRFQALRSRALPCVGRDAEIEYLFALWGQAKAGTGRVVVVSGDPGIGKSRIVLELLTAVRRESPTILRYHCSPHHQNSILHPVLEQLRRAARFNPANPGAATLERLKALLPDQSAQTGAAIALLADLMALQVGRSPREADLDAQRKRELLFEVFVSNLQRLASERPVLLVMEDAHWIDPTSRALVDLFVSRMGSWPILLVITGRVEYEPVWLDEPHAARLELKPVEASDAEYLIKRIPGAESLPDAVVQGIAARADGIPLFIEELTKAVVESRALDGAGEVLAQKAPAIPSSLHASLTARLDRLGKSREVARVAAALGREFAFDLLLAVMPDRATADLRAALKQLVEAELLSPAEPSSAEAYTFRHALIQDAAYNALPRDERKDLHARIALALQDSFSETVATQPEIVAGHFTKAGRAEPAIRYWIEAGNRAVGGSALVDAVKHFSEAIRLTRELPPSPARDATELKLHLALGPAVMATDGYAARTTLQVFLRARELAGPSSTASEQLEVMAGLFNVHYGRAELEQAMAIARQHLALAQNHREAEARAHCFMGQTYHARGTFSQARVHFERTLAIFAESPEDTRGLGVYGSQHVVSLAFLAGVYWALGEPEKAGAATAHSIAYASKSGHLVSIALALITRLLTPIPGGLKGDPAEAEEAVQFCVKHGLRNFEVWARFAQGAILARRGDPQSSIEVMQDAIDAAEAMGSRLFKPVQLATLASAYARLLQPAEALALLEQAIAVAQETGERRADSALHRLRAEIWIAIGRRAEGERDLLRALEIAKAQHAQSEVDRTNKTMARLLTK